MKKSFQNNLRMFRVQAGLRQKDVAEKLGLKCEDRLSHWEQGIAMPNVVNLFKLAGLYKTSCKQIYPEL